MENGFATTLTDNQTQKTFTRKNSSRIRHLMSNSLSDSLGETDLQHNSLMPEESSDQYLIAKFGDMRRLTTQTIGYEAVKTKPKNKTSTYSQRNVPQINIEHKIYT